MSGGGKIILGVSDHNRIVNPTSTVAVLDNIDNTIQGAGVISGEYLGIENGVSGVINATQAPALTIDNVSSALLNDGTLKATGSGGLTIEGRYIENGHTGVILAGAGSIVRLENILVRGGTLKSSGTGLIAMFDSDLAGVVNRANIQVINGGVLGIESPLQNDGTITMASGPSPTEIDSAVGLTLQGTGTILLGVSGGNSFYIGGKLINTYNTISGAGIIDCRSGLTNQAGGLIDANGAAALTIQSSNEIGNAGTIEATGTGSCIILNGLDNKGTIAAVGGTIWLSGAVTGTGQATIDGGALDFLFSVNENVDFVGTSGRLELAHSSSFDKAVIGFAATGGTSLDLDDIEFVSPSEATFSGTASGGVLTVTDGVHTANVKLKGNYLSSTFIASSDGNGGTAVVAQNANDPIAPTHAFVSAMAGFGAPAGHAIHTGEPGEMREFLFTSPRVASA